MPLTRLLNIYMCTKNQIFILTGSGDMTGTFSGVRPDNEKNGKFCCCPRFPLGYFFCVLLYVKLNCSSALWICIYNIERRTQAISEVHTTQRTYFRGCGQVQISDFASRELRAYNRPQIWAYTVTVSLK